MVSRRGVLAALGLGSAGYGSVVALHWGYLPDKWLPESLQPTDTAGASRPWDSATAARAAHRATNEARRAHGRSSLPWSQSHANAAADYAERMAVGDFFSHRDRTYEGPERRYEEAGVCYAGENISRRVFQREYNPTYQDETRVLTTPAEVGRDAVRAWMDSKGHRENILRRSHSREGIGMALRQGENEVLAVQIFC